MRLTIFAMLLALMTASQSLAQQEKQHENVMLKAFVNSKTIVFLGDSITYSGQYLAVLEDCLLANKVNAPRLLNCGLGSETCSGESEPAHPWPRPNVHERFERLLEKVEPDLLVVNYGMNDGIYHPFDEKRFQSYKDGIEKIIEAANQSNGDMKVILLTPPPFDALPLKLKNSLATKDAKEFNWKTVYENYDTEVLAVYSKWILEQESRVAGCIDMRTPILEALAEKRKTDPKFRFAHDGVHLNSAGQKIMGQTIAKALGVDPDKTHGEKVLKAIKERQNVHRDSWLAEVGHKRPGVKSGMKIEAAKLEADKIDLQIEAAIKKGKQKERTNENTADQ